MSLTATLVLHESRAPFRYDSSRKGLLNSYTQTVGWTNANHPNRLAGVRVILNWLPFVHSFRTWLTLPPWEQEPTLRSFFDPKETERDQSGGDR